MLGVSTLNSPTAALLAPAQSYVIAVDNATADNPNVAANNRLDRTTLCSQFGGKYTGKDNYPRLPTRNSDGSCDIAGKRPYHSMVRQGFDYFYGFVGVDTASGSLEIYSEIRHPFIRTTAYPAGT